jgi:integral membrane protein (TIGR01906 family)
LLIVLLLPLVFVAVSLRLTAGHWFLHWEYNKPGFPPDPFGLTTAERIRLAEPSVDYLVTGAGIEMLEELEIDGEPAYNRRELDHLVDVKRVLWIILGAAIGAGLIVAGSVAALSRRPETRFRAPMALLGGSLLTLGLLVGVGGLMVLSWDFFFTSFHQLFFASGTWIFPYSDTLIRLFPVRFWMDVAATIVGLIVVQALLVGGGAFLWYRSERRSSTPATVL